MFGRGSRFDASTRMGVQGGFGTGRVLMICEGIAIDHDPNALELKLFRAVVNAEGYAERWIEGTSIFHNANALHPVPEDWFPGAAHHHILPDGQMLSTTPDFHPFGSVTRQMAPADVEAFLAEIGDETHMMGTLRREA